MSYDNSFDNQDIYFGAGPELNYYDDLEIDFWKEMPSRPPQERGERPRKDFNRMQGVDYGYPPEWIEMDSLRETFGDQDNDDREQPRVNDESEAEVIENQFTNFRLFRLDIRHNHWF